MRVDRLGRVVVVSLRTQLSLRAQKAAEKIRRGSDLWVVYLVDNAEVRPRRYRPEVNRIHRDHANGAAIVGVYSASVSDEQLVDDVLASCTRPLD